ncbi:hypothetical protein [Chryseobacterium vrystaatense]|uniref:Uncharacterized protein n=1 Tax=Chryseobacterium vrystaatense TaxID=307480 RepID=A0A1M5ILG7_9FLAO|nr:hypothetical protein [Chryseobacterium vrystaatense]SHG29111.1 hypothetical protein SAMN02787073_3912 [Chryseobacterium vrystaatense]
MVKLTIIGSSKPVIGEKEMYSVSSLSGWDHLVHPLKNPLEVPKTHWEVMVKTQKGWRKGGSNKEGQTVPYTFGQKSLLHREIKIVAQQGEDKAELMVHPQRAKESKITKVDLLDANYQPISKGKKLSYKDTIIARAYCVEMFMMHVAFSLWEDDAQGEGHNPVINALNKINSVPVLGTVDEKGIAEAVFRLPAYTMAVQIANARIASGDQDEGATHEYYVTADVISRKIQKASANVNVDNATYTEAPPRQRKLPAGQTLPLPKPVPVTPKPKEETAKFPQTPAAKKQGDPEGKILSAEFIDGTGKAVKNAKTGDIVSIKIISQNMKGKNVKVRIWEEDFSKWSHDLLYEKTVQLIGATSFVNYITLTKEMYNKGYSFGEKELEYFIEVEHNNTSVTSAVIPVTLDAPQTIVPKGKSVYVVGEREVEKREEKANNACGIEYRDKITCTKYGNTYGPVFWGALKLADYKEWDLLLSTNKITLEEKDIIIGMSENEGKLDSVQSYDSEIVTVGAMQKTINPEGYGEFPIQMHEFKGEYPDRFKILFENCGWDVKKEITKNGNKQIVKCRVYYKSTTGYQLKNKMREGFSINNYKKKVQCIPIEPLINASRDPYFQAKQIEDFIKRLHIALDEIVVRTYHLNTKKVRIANEWFAFKARDILKSKLGRATLLDQSVNRPALTKFDLGSAMNRFFEKNPKVSKNPGDWGSKHIEYEKQILDDYGMHRNGTDMLGRYNRMKNNSHLK